MTASRPNVIIVITDDQGYGDLACHVNPVALTPNLDRLHDEIPRLGDFHVAPMCTPTRGQLLSGLHGCRNGAVNVSSGRTMLRADLPTMADAYRTSGYRTGLFGKWHLGDARAGTYTFELRRWPRESGLKRREACPASNLYDGKLDAGEALPIGRACLMIDRRMDERLVGPDDDCAIFTCTLPTGRTLLHTWFDDDRGEPICGAYYVHVERQGDGTRS